MIQHILVAHDLSSEADVALRRAAQLARQTDARLSLLHVLDATDEALARAHLQARLDELGLDELEPWIRRGRVAEEVLTQACGLEADLLVLGRHHRQSAEGFAGTTLERILLATPAPLLLAVNPVSTPYSRALAALDFSPCASRALQSAWGLLPAGARLRALNVIEIAEIHAPDEAELTLQGELFGQLVEDLQLELDERDVELETRLRQGERSNCLDAELNEWRPQLLALGGHSRGEMSNALLGSLTRQYLDQPPCDILIAR